MDIYISKELSQFANNETYGKLYFNNSKFCPISSSLLLKSDYYIDGNGATLVACGNSSMSFIGNPATEISNIRIENLTFLGRYDDQGIHVFTYEAAIKNICFENVKIKGCGYSVHANNIVKTSPIYDTFVPEKWNWTFNNCEFSGAYLPIHLNFMDGFKVTNSHINASGSIDLGQHCVYIGCGCSNIVIDNCLLENATGGGIHQRYAHTIAPNRYCHDNRYTNLQIRNCNYGVGIGLACHDILVENIYATNVTRGLHLENCTNITVNNFNMSGAFSSHTFRINDDKSVTEGGDNESDWCGIYIKGYVDATINDSHFNTGGVWFVSSALDIERTPISNQQIDVNLEFNRCIFETTNHSTTKAMLGIGGMDDALNSYLYNVDFNKCQFLIKTEYRGSSILGLAGMGSEQSTYNFNNCVIAYRYGDINQKLSYDYFCALKDLSNIRTDISLPDDLIPNENPMTMPKAYLVNMYNSSFATFTDCWVYDNLANGPDSSIFAFVANSAVAPKAPNIPKVRIEGTLNGNSIDENNILAI